MKAIQRRRRKLSPKQRRFCDEYSVDCNATKAAERAGYSRKTAYSQGFDLLKKPEIQLAIQERAAERAAKLEMDEQFVLERLKWIIDCDPRQFFDENGGLKDIKDLTEEQAKALASFEVVTETVKSGDGQIEYVRKIKFSDRLKAMELLMRKLGMLKEQPSGGGGERPISVTVAFINANGRLDSSGASNGSQKGNGRISREITVPVSSTSATSLDDPSKIPPEKARSLLRGTSAFGKAPAGETTRQAEQVQNIHRRKV